MDTIVAGSIEYLSVKWTDRRSLITDLTSLSPTFDVMDKDDVLKQTAVACTISGMTAYCLINTTAGGTWVSGIYRLYIRFTSSPETPLHGPFPFKVEVR